MNQRPTHIRRFLLATLLPTLLVTAAHGQPVVWNNTAIGGAAGGWSTASNWNPAMVPTSASNAQIGNGGEARITTNVLASRIEVGKNGGVGRLTSDAAAIEIVLDSDFDIGEIGGDFATGPVMVTSDGFVSISNAARLLIGDSGSGDLDIGQTNATAGAQAEGLGVLSLKGVSLVEVIDDADVGQAGGSAVAHADGTLLVDTVGDFQIGADLDIGQSGGSGQSTAFGRSLVQSSSITVGADADIGRTTGSSAGNSGNGMLTATDSTISVGFGNTSLPGSLNIGDAGAEANLRANGLGTVTLDRTTLDVADKINIGGLSGGGSNGLNSADGSLALVASAATAAEVSVAVVTASTAGSATGRLQLDGSLLTIGGTLGLGSGATLSFALAGTARADGTGLAGQYGAMDAATGMLQGRFEVLLAESFTPADGDQFDLIRTTGILAHAFSSSSLPALPGGLSWNLMQTSNLLRLEVEAAALDGDFDADGDTDGNDFLLWQRGLGTLTGASRSQGDADLDGDVDQFDLSIWESTYGAAPGSQAVNALTAVPEPGTEGLVLFALALFGNRHRRSDNGHSLRLQRGRSDRCI